ncbi:MAG: hypothetical protein WD425_04035 [Nitrospirales bacterium]
MSEEIAPYYCVGGRGASRKYGLQSLRRRLILVKTLQSASGIYVWKKVVDHLNNRPRKTRGYRTLNQIFNNQFVPLVEQDIALTT